MALTTRPKRNTAAHRKRSGSHHHHSKHYLNTYWPYLPMLLIVAFGLFVNSLWSNHAVLGVTSDFGASSLLSDNNTQRQADHENPLTLDSQLTAAAQAKANDMVKRDYWAHNSPSGQTPWSFITAAGYQYQSAGENLAYGFGNAGQVVTAWMNSPEHRANILDGNYQNVGFGVAQSPDYQGQGPETVVVAEYAQPVAAAADITFQVPNTPSAPVPTSSVQGDTTQLPTQRVARIQLWTGGQAAWSLVAVSVLAGAALAVLLLRYSYKLHRLINRGEAFVVQHPLFDIAVTFIATAGFVLTRTSGLIR